MLSGNQLFYKTIYHRKLDLIFNSNGKRKLLAYLHKAYKRWLDVFMQLAN